MPVTIPRWTRGGFAVAAVVALALSACSPSDSPDETAPSTSGSPSAGTSTAVAGGSAEPSPSKSASPTPVPASSKGPAKNWPVPKMPEAAKKKTPEGLKAFSEYYFDLMSYTIVTNDSKPIEEATSPYCDVCAKGFIDAATSNKKSNSWAAGGEYSPTITSARLVGKDAGAANYRYTQAALTLYRSGGKAYGNGKAINKPVIGTFGAFYEDGTWKMTEINDSTS